MPTLTEFVIGAFVVANGFFILAVLNQAWLAWDAWRKQLEEINAPSHGFNLNDIDPRELELMTRGESGCFNLQPLIDKGWHKRGGSDEH